MTTSFTVVDRETGGASPTGKPPSDARVELSAPRQYLGFENYRRAWRRTNLLAQKSSERRKSSITQRVQLRACHGSRVGAAMRLCSQVVEPDHKYHQDHHDDQRAASSHQHCAQ